MDMVLEQAYDLRNGVVRLCYNKDYVSGCLEVRRIAGSKVSYYQLVWEVQSTLHKRVSLWKAKTGCYTQVYA